MFAPARLPVGGGIEQHYRETDILGNTLVSEAEACTRRAGPGPLPRSGCWRNIGVEPRRLENRPARDPARRGHAGRHRRLLARGPYGCRTRQASPVRPATPQRARPSWRARICRKWASCSVTNGMGPPPATPTLRTNIWSRRRRRSDALSRRRWLLGLAQDFRRKIVKLRLIRYGCIGEPDFVHSLWKSVSIRFSKCNQHLVFIHESNIIVFEQYHGGERCFLIHFQFLCLSVQQLPDA